MCFHNYSYPCLLGLWIMHAHNVLSLQILIWINLFLSWNDDVSGSGKRCLRSDQWVRKSLSRQEHSGILWDRSCPLGIISRGYAFKRNIFFIMSNSLRSVLVGQFLFHLCLPSKGDTLSPFGSCQTARGRLSDGLPVLPLANVSTESCSGGWNFPQEATQMTLKVRGPCGSPSPWIFKLSPLS